MEGGKEEARGGWVGGREGGEEGRGGNDGGREGGKEGRSKGGSDYAGRERQ